MIPALLERFRVMTWDFPGHSASASAAWPGGSNEITPVYLAEETLALAALAGAETFHFVGTSIGGAIIGTPEAWNTRSANVLELGLNAMAVDIVPRWFGPVACDQQPSLVEGWRVIMGRGDNRSYALLCEMLGRVDFREQLGSHRVPLLLIGGSANVATPPETLQALAHCSGVPEPVILEQVGTFPQWNARTGSRRF